LLAAIGKPREALRAAVVHVLFNVFGVLLWVGLIPYLAEFVTLISPAYPQLHGIDRLAAETPRQIANAHTVFNVANTFIFIGFTSQFVRLVEKLVPDKPLDELVIARPKYLDEELIATPSLALERARMEIGHMGGRVLEMLERIMPAIITGNRSALKQVAKIDDEVDILHGHVITYLGQISQKSLTDEQTRELLHLMSAVNDLENIGDIIETDLVLLGNKRIEQDVAISESTRAVLENLHETITLSVELALKAVEEYDQKAAQEVVARKGDINQFMESAAIHEAKRLVAEEPNRLAAYTLEMDILEKLKRIYYFAKRMSKEILPLELAERVK
jgi:phosphate:Na+ symporter